MNPRQPRVATAEPAAMPLKTVPQLRVEVRRLEGELEQRKLLFVELCEKSNTSTAVSPAAPAKPETGSAAEAEHEAEERLAEVRRLQSRNTFLGNELKMLEPIERRLANDPRVLDKRNEVRLVQMQIAQVEREIATLQTVRKRRDQGLRAIGRNEEVARRERGHQHEVNAELREEVKQLTEELRRLEKIDIEVHERCAKLQDQVKLGVTEADVQRLRDEVVQSEDNIRTLSEKEAAWRQRRASAREEDHRAIAKMRRECAKMEEEEARLQTLLRQKDTELKRSYQGPGRFGLGGGGGVV